MISRTYIKLLAGCLAFFIIILFLVPYDRHANSISHSLTSTPQADTSIAKSPKLASSNNDVIPNIIHFVYVLPDPSSDFKFEFKHYLSIYAAQHYWNPDTIYIHTNAQKEPLYRAQNGSSGRWNKLVFGVPGVVVNNVTVSTHADNGYRIKNIEHKSDFVRVKSAEEIGGVYIDFDVHALRDIRVIREAGFRGVVGRQYEGKINSGVFMTAKGGKMTRLWSQGMHEQYNGGWTIHSNDVLTRVAEKLIVEPREVMIMEQNAFSPGSWYEDDELALWMPHDDVTSNLSNRTQGDKLPSFDSEAFNEWRPLEEDDKTDQPQWARDWSPSYMLHAFSPRFVPNKESYPSITPRYVLERRSNFARAVYPVAKEMYDTGLIDFDDDKRN